MLELSTAFAHSRAWYSLIELGIFSTSAGFYTLRGLGCEYYLVPGDPASAQLLIASWVMTMPALGAMLWLITRTHWAWPVIATLGTWFSMSIRAVMALTPSSKLRAILLLCRVCGAIAIMGSLSRLMARMIAQMISAKHWSKALALGFALCSYVVIVSLHFALARLAQRGIELPGIQRACDILVFVGLRVILVRSSQVSNQARMEVRQLEVMRAIESSTSYKTASDMKAAVDQRDAFMAAGALRLLRQNASHAPPVRGV